MALYVNRRRGSVGFTLIELLITITILVIVTMAAIPSFNRMMWRNRIITTSNEIIAVIKLAQTEAMIRKQRVIIAMDKTNLHHWTIYIQPFGTSALDPMPSTATVLREMWLDERLELVVDQKFLQEQHKLQIMPNGMMASVTAHIENHVNSIIPTTTGTATGVSGSGRMALPTTGALAVCSKQLSGENAIDMVLDRSEGYRMLPAPSSRSIFTRWRKAGANCTAPTTDYLVP